MPKKYYYALVGVNSNTVLTFGGRVDLYETKEAATIAKLGREKVVPIPAADLNQFIQQYIPVKPVDQESAGV